LTSKASPPPTATTNSSTVRRTPSFSVSGSIIVRHPERHPSDYHLRRTIERRRGGYGSFKVVLSGSAVRQKPIVSKPS
jgi:hypothetical protein